MRTITIDYGVGESVTMQYPDYSLFSNDTNQIRLVANDTSQKIGVDITITDDDGNTWTIEQEAFGHFIVIDLRGIVNNVIADYGAMTELHFNVRCFAFGTSEDETFDVQLLNGKTLPLRVHGNTRVIRSYITDAGVQNEVEVFIAKGDTYNIDIGASHLADEDVIVTLSINDDYEHYVYSDGAGHYSTDCDPMLLPYNPFSELTNFRILVKRVCLPERGLFIKYIDTDGCTRIIGGKLLNYERGSENYEYRKGGGAIGAISYNHSQEVTIGIENVEYGEYLTDMKFADNIQLYNSYEDAIGDYGAVSAVVENIDYEEDGAIHDMVVTFKTMK